MKYLFYMALAVVFMTAGVYWIGQGMYLFRDTPEGYISAWEHILSGGSLMLVAVFFGDQVQK